jgi:TrmH RNA methyltransferase
MGLGDASRRSLKTTGRIVPGDYFLTNLAERRSPDYGAGMVRRDPPTKTSPSPRLFPEDSTRELKVYGFHACHALAARRKEDIIRVLLNEELKGDFRELLKWCAETKRAYRFVPDAELKLVSGSQHHEGVCMVVRERQQPTLETLMASGNVTTLLLLDRVGNPHNLGAILRIAAHFGVDGVLIAADDTVTVSGAALRVAEGAGEFVPVVRLQSVTDELAALKEAGFSIVAADGKSRNSLFAARFPERVVLLFGSEGEGLHESLRELADLQVAIPGSGTVESLNVACAASTVLGELWRQREVRENPVRERGQSSGGRMSGPGRANRGRPGRGRR